MVKQPDIKVGILTAPSIDVTFFGEFKMNDTPIIGKYTFKITEERKVTFGTGRYEQIDVIPTSEDCFFEISDVTIGVNFHWERKEAQRFKGAARFIVENGQVTIINILPTEDYLLSVISSEMSATASLELLKAHAVISRSWLLAQIDKNKKLSQSTESYSSQINSETERIRWYDREDHVNFDVCADDHCQRYQGITRQSTPKVAEAINATKGEVLMYEGELCDARFSKCCGGVYEEFENCWENKHFRYLTARRDSANEIDFPNLKSEDTAKVWIMTSPDAFCNSADASILSQVLNNYDQETTDFYRWKVSYSQSELSELIYNRSGIDFGDIKQLNAVERGTSGRIVKLQIIGTKRTMVIGKELEIRRILSHSHLYSSAFVVERHEVDNKTDIPQSFTLYGAGWGHGVGLCQIGAAVMGANGYNYRQILSHYFLDVEITKLY
jgi:SpoIID/LytB domain protein